MTAPRRTIGRAIDKTKGSGVDATVDLNGLIDTRATSLGLIRNSGAEPIIIAYPKPPVIARQAVHYRVPLQILRVQSARMSTNQCQQ